jgi:hypothetical protein
MRHCVVCHADYVDDHPRCPDCGHRTLDADERAVWDGIREELTQEDMIPVHVFDGPVDRAIIDELLADADVPHMVRGNAFGGATLTAQSGGWGVLLVPEAHVAQARGLVKQYLESEVVDHGAPA